MTTYSNPEEEYFFSQNQELIKKNREKLDGERQERAGKEKQEAHWMKCPKCGSDLAEIEMATIMVDKCQGCGGVFFDSGELELLMEAQKPDGFLAALRKSFSGQG